jgi:hypothetical protein
MKLTKEQNKSYEQYIIEAIDESGYDEPLPLCTDKQKLQFLHDTFVSEYWHEQNQKRYHIKENAFREWIMGLPSCFNIEWENYKILDLAVRMGNLPEDYTKNQADKILENYFAFITAKVFRLFRKYKIV